MKRIGLQTYSLENPSYIASYASVVGKKEGEGPLAKYFDRVHEDGVLGLKDWEHAESAFALEAFNTAMSKGGYNPEDLSFLLAGDLLDQCASSAFGFRDTSIPFLGLYGACSTMAEGLALGSMLLDGGFGETLGVCTSSHFCGAEKQFRLPLESGSQRPPTAQWTVTGAGSIILDKKQTPNAPYITSVTPGKIVDMGIKDAGFMGAAMAPAAFDTISAYFKDTNTSPKDYDKILTGDLGKTGSEILVDLFKKDGVALGDGYSDCGVMMFDTSKEDTAEGGSGCACSASVLCGCVLSNMREGKWRDILFCGTGALFSAVSAKQGESIPGICHLVRIKV